MPPATRRPPPSLRTKAPGSRPAFGLCAGGSLLRLCGSPLPPRRSSCQLLRFPASAGRWSSCVTVTASLVFTDWGCACAVLPGGGGLHRGADAHFEGAARAGRSWLPGRSRGPVTLHLAHAVQRSQE